MWCFPLLYPPMKSLTESRLLNNCMHTSSFGFRNKTAAACKGDLFPAYWKESEPCCKTCNVILSASARINCAIPFLVTEILVWAFILYSEPMFWRCWNNTERVLYNTLNVCSEESENFDQEIGWGRTVIMGKACMGVCSYLWQGGGRAASKSWRRASSVTALL